MAKVATQAVAGIVLVLLLVGAAMGGAAVHAYLSGEANAEQQSRTTPAYVAEPGDTQEPHPNQVANERELDCGIGRVMAEDGTCVSESFYEAQANPKPLPKWATPAGKRETRERIVPCPGNKLMAEDGSCVPPSFYHTQLKREAHKAKRQQRMKANAKPKADGTCRGNRVMAEDGSCVPPDYWDKTDYRPVEAAK